MFLTINSAGQQRFTDSQTTEDGREMDEIQIRGLRLMAIVGVLAHEREQAQPIQVDLDVRADLELAGLSDDLEHTINYGALSEAVAVTVKNSSDKLLERLAQRVAETALGFPRVLTVTVTKLRPPIPEDVSFTAVRITRQNRQL